MPPHLMPMFLLGAAVLLGAHQPARRMSHQSRPRRLPKALWLLPLLAAAVLLRHLLLIATAAVAGYVAWQLFSGARRQRAHRAEQRALERALNAASTELRAGSPLGGALSSAAQSCEHPIAAAFGSAARSVATGAGAAVPLRKHAAIAPHLGAVAEYWAIAEHHGIGLLPLLEQASTRLSHQIRHEQRTRAALQGPKATAIILCCLPLVGMLLGGAMGVNVPAMLLGTTLGNGLLFAGITMLGAGVLWAQRILKGATQ